MFEQADWNTFRPLVEALLIGLLVGAERYRDRKPEEKRPAGLRTYGLVALLGALCFVLNSLWFTMISFVGLCVLLVLGYQQRVTDSPGITSDISAMIVFWLGYLVSEHEVVSISMGIAVTVVLAAKAPLHGFIREGISEVELMDTLKYLVVVFIVFLMMPDRGMGPYAFFNPRQIWTLIIVVSSISFLGYILVRWLGKTRGMELSGILGGVVSTTAVTMSFAQRAREKPGDASMCGRACVLANAVQFPRLLVLLLVVDPGLARLLAIPFLCAGASGFALALVGRPRALE